MPRDLTITIPSSHMADVYDMLMSENHLLITCDQLEMQLRASRHLSITDRATIMIRIKYKQRLLIKVRNMIKRLCTSQMIDNRSSVKQRHLTTVTVDDSAAQTSTASVIAQPPQSTPRRQHSIIKLAITGKPIHIYA